MANHVDCVHGQHGLFPLLSSVDYHSDPCESPSLNYSTAKQLITESPYHAYQQHPRLGGECARPSGTMDRGSIVHAMLLKQPLDNIHLIEADNYRTKKAKTERDSAREDGKFVILEREYLELQQASKTISSQLCAAGVELSGLCEASAIWASDGVLCRTRMDHLSLDKGTIVDLKCSESVNPRELPRQIHSMCYDLQGAVEIDAIETLFPDLAGRVSFADVFIQMSEPYFVVVARHAESMLSVGRSKWQRAKRMWSKCLSTGEWPGYPSNIDAHAENWAINKEFGEPA